MVRVYTTMNGRWGWFCDRCASESRYSYRDRDRAAELAAKHKCRGGHRARRRI